MDDMLRSDVEPEDLQKYGLLPLGPQSNPPSAVVAGAPHLHEPRCRTGTGPFIAEDLLVFKNPPQHLYRHDLESFFWVLVWFIACFNPKTHKIGHVDAWLLKKDLRSVGEARAVFLSKSSEADRILKKGDEKYKAACMGWIISLRTIMYEIHRDYDDFCGRYFMAWRSLEATNAKKQEMNVHIRRLVEDREKHLTYETFMSCLV